MKVVMLFCWVVLGEVCWSEDKLSTKDRLALLFLGEEGGDNLFYYPTKKQPFTPQKYGYLYEDVFFKSEDGTKLHGWFLPAQRGALKAKGTIVFSHGNAGSLANHFGFTYWMVRAGYNVFMYDYRAYGKSEGELSRKGLVEDAVAAFHYIVTRKDVNREKLVSFGHSLGGAKSIAALALVDDEILKGVCGVVVDSTFYSYGDMASKVAGATGRKLVSAGYDPGVEVKKLPKLPFLVIHGIKDRTIPVQQAEKLFEAAGDPKKFFKVQNGGHTNSLDVNKGEYREKVIRWLDEVFAN